jgi:ubiquitin carboxyl-terminal hydrolase 7
VVNIEKQGMYSNAVSYYNFLQNRLMVHFKPKDDNSEKVEFSLTLSKKITYDTVSILLLQLFVEVV